MRTTSAGFFIAALLAMGAMTMHAGAKRIPLEGEWLFRVDTAEAGIGEGWYRQDLDRTEWQKVQIPKFWETYPGLADYDGWGWFVRSFIVDDPSVPLTVYFAGVDDDAQVWINGHTVGDHTGYSDPFALDIHDAVTAGTNTIAVLVKDYAGGGGIYRPVTIIETARIEDLLRGPYADLMARPSADWVQDGAIYSVYLRSFSPEGTFAGLERRLTELRDLGVTTLWLMPIHPVGLKNRKGTLGSPYAVQDYYGINPEFGTLADFRRLVQRVHAEGMKIIIDLVANHASWDSKLIEEHPEWFTHNERGEILPPNADWLDVADLDYGHEGLRTFMIDMMCWWVRDVGIDGFRCDVAELVPTDFWERARVALDAIKPVMMLSEGSLPEHHVRAFDLTYAWNTYDVLEPLLTGKRPVALLDQIVHTEQLQFPHGSLRMRFVTNHDKNAWDAPAVEKFGPDGLQLATVLITTYPGVPLIYTGEEVANDRKLSLFEKVDVDWSRPRDVGEIYRTLFALRRTNPALSRGSFHRVPGSPDDDVYAFLRTAGSWHVFVILNFSRHARRATLRVPVLQEPSMGERVRFREVLSGAVLEIPAAGVTMAVQLEPRGYRVFVSK